MKASGLGERSAGVSGIALGDRLVLETELLLEAATEKEKGCRLVAAWGAVLELLDMPNSIRMRRT